jgi:hypothetical protein
MEGLSMLAKLLLIVFLVAPQEDPAPVDSSIIEKIRKEAIPVWRKEQSRIESKLHGRYSWSFQREVLSGEKLRDTPENLGAKATYECLISNNRFAGGSPRSLVLNNERYIAKLQRTDATSDWVIKDGKWRVADAVIPMDYRESELRGFLSASYPMEEGLIDMLENEAAISIARMVDGIVEIEAKSKRNRSLDIERLVLLRLDPNENWRCIAKRVLSKTEKGESAMSFSVDAEPVAGDGFITKQLQCVSTSASDVTFKQIETWKLLSYENEMPNPKEFYLPFYKIPESALNVFDAPPPIARSNIVVLMGALVAIFGFLFSYWISKRKKAS